MVHRCLTAKQIRKCFDWRQIPREMMRIKGTRLYAARPEINWKLEICTETRGEAWALIDYLKGAVK